MSKVELVGVGLVFELVIAKEEGVELTNEEISSILKESIDESYLKAVVKRKKKILKKGDPIPKGWTNGLPWPVDYDDEDSPIEDAINDMTVKQILDKPPKVIQNRCRQCKGQGYCSQCARRCTCCNGTGKKE